MTGWRYRVSLRCHTATDQTLRLDELVELWLARLRNCEIEVLEAGCGARSPIDFGARAHVVGLDIDKGAISRNKKIDEVIVGDLESYPLPTDAFD